MQLPPSSLLVTGTDTGIGKTIASVALLNGNKQQRVAAVGFKPVAAGCELVNGQWRNDDALALQAASSPTPAYADINPYALPLATAPQLAARAAGVQVRRDVLQAAFARLQAQAEVVVVEGAGGWLAPLGDGLEHADLAHTLGLPVVLVVGMRLGCLNHARLSARAITADGCQLIGWIANSVDPEFDRDGAYLQLLRDALPVACLGRIAYGGDVLAVA